MSFSSPTLNASYASVTDPGEHKIEAGLTLTDLFLDSVLQLPLLPFDIAEQIDLQDMSAFVEACVNDWDDIVTSNWRFLTAFIFGAIMIIVSLIAAIGFCCARCCCRGKGPPSKRSDSVAVCGHGSFLLLSCLAVAFGVAWYALAAAELGSDVENELVPSIDAIIYDTNLFISNTVEQVDHFTNVNLLTEFTQQVDDVIAQLESDADEVGKALLDDSGYRDITEITMYLNDTLVNFVEVESVNIIGLLDDGTASLMELQGDLDTYKAASDWSELEPSTAFCIDWDDIASSDSDVLTCLELSTAKTNLPPIETDAFDSVKSIFEGEVEVLSAVTGDLAQLTDILVDGEVILGNLSGYFDLTDLEKIIDDITNDVQDEINVVLEGLGDIELERPAELGDLQDSLDEYGSYVTYSLMYVPTVIISLTLLLLVMGCCCGATGKPGSATRKHGANMLCAGNCVFLLVAAWMWTFTVIFFLSGGTLQRIGCFTMELKETEMTAPLDREIDELIHQGC